MKRIIGLSTALCALLVMGAAAAGETTAYSGTSRTVVSKSALPLGNGDSVVTAVSRGVAALSSTPPMLLEMNCVGLGLLGAQESYAADFYCSLKADAENVLDLKGSEGTPGSQFTVLGGSGRWKGATGQGTFKRQTSSETEASATFEMTVTTP
jgi:hypothetical protein